MSGMPPYQIGLIDVAVPFVLTSDSQDVIIS